MKDPSKNVIEALIDSDLIDLVIGPACFKDLKENQVVVTVNGSKEKYLVTVEKY